VEEGADPKPAMEYVVRYGGNFEDVKFLVEVAGAADYTLALECAASKEQWDVVNHLIEKGEGTDLTAAVKQAAQVENWEELEFLVEQLKKSRDEEVVNYEEEIEAEL